MPTRTTGRYHHGDLRRALLAAAAGVVEEQGPVAVSLRDLARRTGVSHAAPAHHFGDKTGLLTALAAEGFELLAERLSAAAPQGLLPVGIAYVRFAGAHRGHFAVMFRRDLLDVDDPDLVRAMHAANAPLRSGIMAELTAAAAGNSPARGAGVDVEAVAVGLWAQMHGLAALWTNGNLPAGFDEPDVFVRRVSDALDAAAALSLASNAIAEPTADGTAPPVGAASRRSARRRAGEERRTR